MCDWIKWAPYKIDWEEEFDEDDWDARLVLKLFKCTTFNGFKYIFFFKLKKNMCVFIKLTGLINIFVICRKRGIHLFSSFLYTEIVFNRG